MKNKLNLKTLGKVILLLIILFSPSNRNLLAQLTPEHNYFKINDVIVNTESEVPLLLTKVRGDFIHKDQLNINEDIEFIINKDVLAERFKDSRIELLTKVRADFNFTIESNNNPALTEYPGFTEYAFNRNVFTLRFKNSGTYVIQLNLFGYNGVLIATEGYIVNAAGDQQKPDILINNIPQVQKVLPLQGDEKLTFTTNFSSNEYEFVWGNNKEVFSLNDNFAIDLNTKNPKPEYLVLRTTNKATKHFSESYIYFDYSNSTTYVVKPTEEIQSGYDQAPPEVVEDSNSNTTVLLALAGLSLLIGGISFVMFRFIKSAKISSS